MAVYSSVENVTAPYSFLQTHSRWLRLWHWITFLVISASMITVLIGSTSLAIKKNSSLVQTELKKKGVDVTIDQARSIAHEYSDKMWIWHTYFGYALTFLFLSRIVIEIFQPAEEKFNYRLARVTGIAKNTATRNPEAEHYKWVKKSYLAFYCLLLMMVVTGLGLAFEQLPIFKKLHGLISSVHQVCQYLIYAFVVFHIGGVIRSELRKNKGIVSGMIHGNK
jgi:cytochrome b